MLHRSVSTVQSSLVVGLPLLVPMLLSLLSAGCTGGRRPAETSAEMSSARTRSLGEFLDDALADETAMPAAAAAIAVQDGGCALAQAELVSRFRAGSLAPASVDRGVTLYLKCAEADAGQVFAILAADGREEVTKTAWRLAVARPSATMAVAVSAQLSKLMLNADAAAPKTLLQPAVADAIRVNKVADAYPVLRQGLTGSGQAAFARAMVALDPARASDDLLVYLSKVSAEELQSGGREAQQETWAAILTMMTATPPSFHHPNLGHLFLYAAGKGAKASQAAQKLLGKLAASDSNAVAESLAKLGAPEQILYLRRTSTDTSEPIAALRRQLKAKTTHPEVTALLAE